MSTKLFVGNLPWSTTEEELQEVFSQFGEVVEVSLPTDKMTGRKRGFGFVTFADEAAASAAVEGMNEKELGGRPLTVNVARPRRDEGGFNAGASMADAAPAAAPAMEEAAPAAEESPAMDAPAEEEPMA